MSAHLRRSVNWNIYVSQFSIISKGAVPWLRQLDFDVRLRRSAFDRGSVHQGILLDKITLNLGFLLVLSFHSRHDSDEEPPSSHNEGMGSNPCLSTWVLCCHYRCADKSLAPPGKKRNTATADFEFRVSYF